MKERRKFGSVSRMWITAAAICLTGLTFSGPAQADVAPATAVDDSAAQVELIPETTAGSDQPTGKPADSAAADLKAASALPVSCSETTTDGVGLCVQESAPPDDRSAHVSASRAAAAAAVDPPQWCEDSNNTIIGNRTAVCRVSGLLYWTYETVNGQQRTTGEAHMIVINYSYGNTGMGRFAHQIELSAYKGWGVALNASVSGNAYQSKDCTLESSSFPAKPLLPLNSWRAGESFFDTTATAAGAMGSCTTTWNLTFRLPGLTPAMTQYSFDEFRCDNNTRGRAVVGCVIPWYASALTYSGSVIPNIVRHVRLAQNSGLPGASFAAPLKRTTNDRITFLNRSRACGDAPSIQDMTCDEYPVATSGNGLANGGTRRTFDGCQMDHVPSGTGSAGASVCMVPGTENNSQSGTNTQFYRAERMLDGDPFRVLLIS